MGLRFSKPFTAPVAAKSLPPPLLYADTDRSPDALYFGRVGVPDAFVAFGSAAAEIRRRGGTRIRPRAKNLRLRRRPPARNLHAARPRTLAPTPPRSRRGDLPPRPRVSVRRFTVPEDFPAGCLRETFELGVSPHRRRRRAVSRSASSRPRRSRRHPRGQSPQRPRVRRRRKNPPRQPHLRPPTPVPWSARHERIAQVRHRGRILEAGGVSAGTIVAGGDQACDPHERGSGPLRPHELIIVDIFPRVTAPATTAT
jgi:Xaa-Pro aminopeptidase